MSVSFVDKQELILSKKRKDSTKKLFSTQKIEDIKQKTEREAKTKYQEITKEINDSYQSIYKNITNVESEFNSLVGFYITNVVPEYFKEFGNQRNHFIESDMSYDIIAIEDDSYKQIKNKLDAKKYKGNGKFKELISLYDKHNKKKAIDLIGMTNNNNNNKTKNIENIKENLRSAIKGKSKYFSHILKFNADKNKVLNLDFMELINEIKFMEIANERAVFEKKTISTIELNKLHTKENLVYLKQLTLTNNNQSDFVSMKHYKEKYPNDFNDSFESQYFYNKLSNLNVNSTNKQLPNNTNTPKEKNASTFQVNQIQNALLIKSCESDADEDEESDEGKIKENKSKGEAEDSNEGDGNGIKSPELLHNSILVNNNKINQLNYLNDKSTNDTNNLNNHKPLENGIILLQEIKEDDSEEKVNASLTNSNELITENNINNINNNRNELGKSRLQHLKKDNVNPKRKRLNKDDDDDEDNNNNYNSNNLKSNQKTGEITGDQIQKAIQAKKDTNQPEQLSNINNINNMKIRILSPIKTTEDKSKSTLNSMNKDKVIFEDKNNINKNNNNNNEFIKFEDNNCYLDSSNTNKQTEKYINGIHPKGRESAEKSNKSANQDPEDLTLINRKSTKSSLNYYYLNLIKTGAKSEDFKPLSNDKDLLSIKNTSKKQGTSYLKHHQRANSQIMLPDIVSPTKENITQATTKNLVIKSIIAKRGNNSNYNQIANNNSNNYINDTIEFCKQNALGLKAQSNSNTTNQEKKDCNVKQTISESAYQVNENESKTRKLTENTSYVNNNKSTMSKKRISKDRYNNTTLNTHNNNTSSLPPLDSKIQKIQNYRSNINYNILTSILLNNNQSKNKNITSNGSGSQDKISSNLQGNNKIALKSSYDFEEEKEIDFKKGIKLSDFKTFTSVENIQIERHLENQNHELSKSRDTLLETISNLYKEVNTIRTVINNCKSEKEAILGGLERKEKEIQLNTEDSHAPKQRKGSISKTQKRISMAQQEKFLLEYNYKNQLFIKYKKEKLAELKLLDNELASMETKLLNTQMKIKKAEESLGVIENEVFQIKNTLLLYYHRLLSMGTDVRANGLSWIIMSIWKLESNVVLSYLPLFFDKENCEYLFLKGHLTILIDKASFWLIKLKEQIRDYNTILTNNFFFGESKRSLNSRQKLKISFETSIIDTHYLNKFYKNQIGVENNNKRLLNDYKEKSSVNSARKEENRVDSESNSNNNYYYYNNKEIENGLSKKHRQIKSNGNELPLDSQKLKETQLRKDSESKERLLENNNVDVDQNGKHHKSSSLATHNELKSILSSKKITFKNNTEVVASLNRPSQLVRTKNLEKFINNNVESNSILNQLSTRNSNGRNYYPNLHKINEMMAKKKDNSELAKHIVLLKSLEKFIKQLEVIETRMKNIEITRMSEENANYHYNENYLKLILKGIFGNKFWSQEYMKIINFEETIKHRLVKCQLTQKNLALLEKPNQKA